MSEPDLAVETAEAGDLSAILAFARDFHAEDGHALSATGERAIAELIDAPKFGELLVIRAGGQAIGYAALCFGYSIEYGGRDAFIDDLYLVPGARGRGLGGRVITALLARARAAGCMALHLEVMDANPARALYARLGFGARGSSFMTARLEVPRP